MVRRLLSILMVFCMLVSLGPAMALANADDPAGVSDPSDSGGEADPNNPEDPDNPPDNPDDPDNPPDNPDDPDNPPDNPDDPDNPPENPDDPDNPPDNPDDPDNPPDNPDDPDNPDNPPDNPDNPADPGDNQDPPPDNPSDNPDDPGSTTDPDPNDPNNPTDSLPPTYPALECGKPAAVTIDMPEQRAGFSFTAAETALYRFSVGSIDKISMTLTNESGFDVPFLAEDRQYDVGGNHDQLLNLGAGETVYLSVGFEDVFMDGSFTVMVDLDESVAYRKQLFYSSQIPDIALNTMVTASIGVEGEVAYFRFHPAETGDYTFIREIDDSSGDAFLCLYNSVGEELNGSDRDLTSTLDASETYYLGVMHACKSQTGDIRVTLQANSAGSGQSSGQSTGVTIGMPGERQSIAFTAAADGLYRFSVQSEYKIAMSLADAAGSGLSFSEEDRRYDSAGNHDQLLTMTAGETVNLTVGFESDALDGSFDVIISEDHSVEDRAQLFASGQIPDLALDTQTQVSLIERKDIQYFRIKTAEEGEYTFNWDAAPESGEVFVVLYTWDGFEKVYSSASGSAAWTLSSTDTYYLGVMFANLEETGDLALTMQRAPSLPKQPAPTDLQWNWKPLTYMLGDPIPARNENGVITFIPHVKAEHEFKLWRDGTPNPVSSYIIREQELSAGSYYVTNIMIGQSLVFGSGTYYFTAQAKGDGVNTADSDLVTSSTWSYTSPAASLDVPQNLRWSGTKAVWDSIPDETTLQYYVVNVEYTENGDWSGQVKKAAGTVVMPGKGNEEDFASLFDSFGVGFYRFSVRSWTDDITVAHSSAYSAYSAEYTPLDAAYRKLKEGCANGTPQIDLRNLSQYGDLIIKENLLIPAGVTVDASNTNIVIPENVILTVKGTLLVSDLEVIDEIMIPDLGWISVFNSLSMGDASLVTMQGRGGILVRLGAWDNAYIGHFSRQGENPVRVQSMPKDEAGLISSVNRAENAPDGVSYDVLLTSPVTLNSSLTVPKNCRLDLIGEQGMADNLTISDQATLTVDGSLHLEYGSLTDYGNLVNNGWIDMAAGRGMPILRVRGEYSGLGMIYVYDFIDDQSLFDGIDLNQFEKKSTEHVTSYTPLVKALQQSTLVMGSVTNVVGGVKITWKKLDAAASYLVYRKTGSEDWTQIAQTGVLAYTDKNVECGTVYTYTVRGERDGVLSKYDTKGHSIKYFDAPGLPTLAPLANNGGIHVSWAKVTGAPKYRVFRKTGNGSWVKVADTTALSYSDKTVKPGSKLTYTIRCVSPDGKSYLSAYNTTGTQITYCAAPVVQSAANVLGGVKVTWAKSSGAVKYRVYRKTGTGSWTKLADTTAQTYTDKTAKSGTKYTYTVRCVSSDGKTCTSSYDTKGKSVTYIAAPDPPTLTAAKGSVTVRWKKSAGAVKYRVFRKTGNGTWVKLTDTASLSYVDRRVTAGTQYSYTIRCISKDGRTYTSAYNTTGRSIRAK